MSERSLKDMVRAVLSAGFAISGVSQSTPAMPAPTSSNTDPGDGLPSLRDDATSRDLVLRPARPRVLLRALDAMNVSLVSSHRSHRSHSSHRSHYSSSSVPAEPRPSNPTTSRAPAATAPTLGSRALMKGMRGPDVDELLTLMIKAKALRVDQVPSEAVFNETIEAAVKTFQKANGLPVDGIVDYRTLLILKSK